MNLFLALLPLLLVIGVLLARQSTLRSALLGLGSAVLIGVLWFGLGWRESLSATGQWWPLVLEVMLIVGGGIAFAEAGRRTGDQAELSGWLRARLGTGVTPALAVVHGVTPLAESLTGFGVGVAIAVPLLLGLGYSGRQAAPLGLLGLCAIPWGAMGPGTLIAAQMAEVGFDDFGVMCAVLSLPVFIGAGIAAVFLIAEPGQRARGMGLAIASGLLLWVGVLGANLLFGTATAGALGAAFTLAVHLLLHRFRGMSMQAPARVWQALAPYGVLLGGVLLLKVLLRLSSLEDTPWKYLGSPAFWLAVAVLFTLRTTRNELRPTLRHATRTWSHVGPATGLFIVLGVVMSVSGMSGQIANGLAELGGLYLFLVPVIGGAGGFLTGSNSGANAMFAGPQAQAANVLGVSALPVVAAQNVSASLLTLASPSRIELAVRLCPDQPERQPVFRLALQVCVALIVILSLLTVLLAT
ncbi:Glycolate permease GlcA [Corynebacterium occultum]|uniref:L-lactate permease n=1 Tax=Corynebacterium occultum TaxID=2675219 RepID=A0A6B8WKD3_9CORY|nr:L-lactate permease [Corynebacterium occultum]QGU06888.1 Glycolate permease GlcA [Corynebacterium occultum]